MGIGRDVVWHGRDDTPRGGVLAMVPVVRLAVFCPPPRCVLPTEAGVKAVQQKRLPDNFAGEPLLSDIRSSSICYRKDSGNLVHAPPPTQQLDETRDTETEPNIAKWCSTYPKL